MNGLDTNVLAQDYIEDDADADTQRQRLMARRLLEQAHITVEERDAVEHSLSNSKAGIEFADALHHASNESCGSVARLVARKFGCRARKLGLVPGVTVVSRRLC